MESQHIFNGDMTRAARILVKVSAQYIAREANVTKEELRDFEKGRHEAPQVSRRILVSWKDANHAEEDRSEGQGAVCAAGVGALAGVPVADRCC